ncbi:MAG: flavodoxin domain-containing protein [Spirochaetia bacterium]
MSDAILVGYATRSGSTKEIAEAIAATLRESGAAVDLRPLKEVATLEGYRSVVLGAPLYMFHWHKDAVGFLNRHHGELAKRPVAIFALGPFKDDEKEWQAVRGQIAAELAKFPWLTPVAQEVFGGKFDPAQLRFPMTLIPALKKMPASDVRNWDAIRGWAGKLAALL